MTYSPSDAYSPGDSTHGEQTDPKRPNRRLRIILIAIAAVVLVTAIVITTVLLTRPGKFDAVGVMTLVGADSYTDGTSADECIGDSGYDDIAAGTQVVVKDETNSTVALGKLSPGFFTDDGCSLVFNVKNVPAGKKFYEVEVSHRGGIQYTEQELRDGIGVSLGSE